MSKDLFQTLLLETAPSSITSDPQVRAACQALDAEFLAASKAIKECIHIGDIDAITDERLLDLLAHQLHVDWWQNVLTGGELSMAKKKASIRESLEWHSRRGTRWIIERAMETLFERVQVAEWFEPDYQGNPYFFKVITSSTLADPEVYQRALEMIYTLKNARSWLEAFIIAKKSELPLWEASITIRRNTVHVYLIAKPTEALGEFYVGIAICIYHLTFIAAPEEL